MLGAGTVRILAQRLQIKDVHVSLLSLGVSYRSALCGLAGRAKGHGIQD
jgi:hypothetical protein